MKKRRPFLAFFTTALIILFAAQSTLAHVTISPRESTIGKLETYTIRVPTERDVPTVRIEIEFPMGVFISDFDTKSGWVVESITSVEGQIKGAAWSGGSITRGESEEFSFTSQNPEEETTLVWKVVQVHSDGSKAEWVGERGSSNPAPVVEVK